MVKREGGRVTGVGVSGVMKRDSFSKEQILCKIKSEISPPSLPFPPLF